MKKFLTIIALLVGFAWMADAQISIKKSASEKPEQMTTLSMSWSWIYRVGDTYYIVMKSDNQFDDHYWLKIGSNKEECLESVESLRELAKTIGDTERFDVDNGEGRVFHVTKYNPLGVTGIAFNGEGFAGQAYILVSNLNKAERWINSKLK